MDKQIFRYLGRAFLIFGIVFISVYIFAITSPFTVEDFEKSGHFGDTLAGISAVWIGGLGVIFTFLAFYVQFQANQQQQNDLRIERFESKFYELLHLYRSNVDSMSIGSLNGFICFKSLLEELRHCYEIVQEQFEQAPEAYEEDFSILEFSYKIFFYGIGPSQERQYRHLFSVSEETLFSQCLRKFNRYSEEYFRLEEIAPNDKFYVISPFDLPSKTYYYPPFQGHSELLGRYYRHLYQTITYITREDRLFPDFNDKYPYVKMLRAQLTSSEQLLIYYNAQAWFDEEWHLFFTRYRLIKNISHGMADFDIPPLARFAEDIILLRQEGIEMFENYG